MFPATRYLRDNIEDLLVVKRVANLIASARGAKIASKLAVG